MEADHVDEARSAGWRVLALTVALATASRVFAHLAFPKTSADVAGYLYRARDFRFGDFYAASDREPLWIGALRLSTEVFGDRALASIVLSVAAGVGVAVWCAWVAGRLAGPRAAAVAGVWMALAPAIVWRDVQGYRDEWASLLLLLALGTILAASGWRRAVGFGVLAGAAALSRFELLGLALAVAAVAVLVRRLPLREAAVGMGIAVALTVPFLAANERFYDDPLYHSNFHARFYWNLDYAGRPGEPTKAEVARYPWAGPSVTWSEYFRSIPLADVPERVVRRGGSLVARGLGHLVVLPSLRPGWLRYPFVPLAILAVVGIAAGVARRGSERWLLVVPPLYGFASYSLVKDADLRLLHYAWACLIVLGGIGLTDLVGRHRRSDPSPPSRVRPEA